ncbi:MAG: nitroreductase family protein [Turicibacter sp.]|nr:nitroreductase family protein [Turicibacter sp.]
MNAIEAMINRTSYRSSYKDTPVPRGDLVKIMEAGLAAPSGSNKQTVSLIAVDDPEILARLAEVTGPLKYQPAPAIICILTQKIPAYKGRHFNVQDYSAAIQNILVAAVSLGYESCWYEGTVKDDDDQGKQMADILGVPADYNLISYSPIGIAEKPVKFPEKKPFAERAWFNGFQKSE